MYHPYFRGKQFELIAIRELAGLLAKKDFIPGRFKPEVQQSQV